MATNGDNQQTTLLGAFKPFQGPSWGWFLLLSSIVLLLIFAVVFLWIQKPLEISPEGSEPVVADESLGDPENGEQPLTPIIHTKRMELNYPPMVVYQENQPVRVLATVLEDDSPITEETVHFSLVNDNLVITNQDSITDEHGQAWMDFPISEKMIDHTIQIEVSYADMRRMALIQVLEPKSESITAEVDSLPPVTDMDNDGLTDAQENLLKTMPGIPDSDGDGIEDGEEYFIFRTNPTKNNLAMLNRDNAGFRSPIKNIQAGSILTNTVRLFDLGVLNTTYTLVFVDAKIRKDMIAGDKDVSLAFISPVLPDAEFETLPNAQLFAPVITSEENENVLWLELTQSVPIILLDDIDDNYSLVRVFGYVSPEVLQPPNQEGEDQ